ncbi:RadC family protein [Bacteroidota bacterium]
MSKNQCVSNLAEISISYSPKVKASDRQKIRCSEEMEKIARSIFPSIEHREFFYLICLDRSNNVLGYHQVSVGGITGTVADVRIIFQTALKANSSGIIITHNHPSGNTAPSDTDRLLTNKIKEAGKLLDIPVLDHLILTEESYLSFADEGFLQ